jgi:tripartite-type tricarboxylate transporter receptor subunit TctC
MARKAAKARWGGTMRRLHALGAALAIAVLSTAAPAQDYPNRPIRFLVSTNAGSAPDLVARIFGQVLSEDFKQNVIVENRPGANGIIAVEAVARAAPDGYTFLVTTASTLSANPFLFAKGMLAVTDLAPISRLIDSDFVIAAHPPLGVTKLDDLVRMIKAKPGTLNAATSFRGGAANLAGELLKFAADLDFVIVPYNGDPAAAAGLDRGEVHFMIGTLTAVEPLAKAGKATLLASLGLKRNHRFPDLPTVHETLVPDFNITGWVALMAPKGTDPKLIELIHGKLAQGVKREDVHHRLMNMDAVPLVNAPQDFALQWKRERDTWERLIKSRNLKIE